MTWRLSVRVSTEAALSNRPAVFGSVGVGVFPRELTVLPGGRTLVVTNFGSGSVMGLSVDALQGGLQTFLQ